MCDPRAVEPLLVMLEGKGEKDKPISIDGLLKRAIAAGALGQIGDIRAVEPLVAALQANYTELIVAAAEALGQIGDVRAVGPLVAKLVYPTDNLFDIEMGSWMEGLDEAADKGS